MPVSAIIPDAIAEYMAIATGTLMSDPRCGTTRLSSSGSVRPATMAHAA
jgi:hypothetical protein